MSAAYINELVARFWAYRKSSFKNREDVFDRQVPANNRPPVFLKEFASENILTKDGISQALRQEIITQIPEPQRHIWFRSMKSSQALAQSVFGNLKVLKKTGVLHDFKRDDGKPLFNVNSYQSNDIKMEYVIDYLGEKAARQTSIDVFFEGEHRIAVECKFAEPEVGQCSRPQIKKNDPRYVAEYCNGCYKRQQNRKSPCSLTELGIKYWQYVPRFFKWPSDRKCPLRHTYQLIRNILAVCVQQDGAINEQKGHVVLVYDERNPAFQPNGKGWEAWQIVKKELKNPILLQKCTWQQIISAMRRDPELLWLTDLLRLKYGF